MEHKKQRIKLNLNFGSLAIGFLLALCLALTIGAAANSNNGLGRYQCCPAGNNDIAVFVIDTETGQTWRLGRTDMYDFGTPKKRKSVKRSVTPLID